MTQPTESMIERLRTFIVQIETMTGDPIKYHPPLCDEAADLLEEAVKVIEIQKSFIFIELLIPTVHPWEIEKREEVRKKVAKCTEALLTRIQGTRP